MTEYELKSRTKKFALLVMKSVEALDLAASFLRILPVNLSLCHARFFRKPDDEWYTKR